jgi:hypothetical protein
LFAEKKNLNQQEINLWGKISMVAPTCDKAVSFFNIFSFESIDGHHHPMQIIIEKEYHCIVT